MVDTGRDSARQGSRLQGLHDRKAAGRVRLLHSTALQAVALSVLSLPLPGGGAVAQGLPAPTQLPTGGKVIAGSAAISSSGATMQVTQGTNRAAVNWQSFSVGSEATVKFAVPSSTSMTINRVVGPDPSVIAGRISSNGQVVLTNQSGITFTQGAQVDVQSLIASAPGISEANARAGKLVFDQPARLGASVANHGTITVAQTGLAALVAPQVANSGLIRARLGHVVLAGAAAHTVDLYGDGLLSIDVTKQVTTAGVGADGKPVTALVTNTGTILADGGTIVLSAAAVDGLVQTLVDSGGTVSAATAGGTAGRIAISGTGGDVIVRGTVAARGEAAGTKGGQVAINAPGHTVTLSPGARVDASGQAGGGLVAVGTTVARARSGPGTAAPTAKNVRIAAGATVAADALDRGHGGNVTVLSAGGSTVHQGTLSARGGAKGGDGGAVELSGDYLALLGGVDVLAPMGVAGSVLLDPGSITIVADDGTAAAVALTNPFDAPDTAAPAETTTVLDYSMINKLSGDVTLQATGTISITGALDLTAKDFGNNKAHIDGFTLLANGDITISAALTGKSNITLAAGATYTDGAAAVQSGLPGAALSIGAAVTGTGGAGTTIALSSTGGGITINAPVSIAGGSISLATTGGGVTQTASGILTAAALLSGAGGVTGNTALTAAPNAISEIKGFNVNGDFGLTDTTALLVSGAVVAGAPAATTLPATATGSVTLSNSAKITVQGDITARATAGGSDGVSLTTTGAGNDIAVTGGTIATDGNVVLSAARSLSLSGGLITAAGTIGATAGTGGVTLSGSAAMTAFGDITLAAGTDITQSGGVLASYGNATLLPTGAFSQTGGTLAAKQTLAITAGAGIGQPGGALFANAIQMSAGGNADISGAGSIGGVPSFAPAGTALPEPVAGTDPVPGALDIATSTALPATWTIAGDYVFIGRALSATALSLTATHDILEHAEASAATLGTVSAATLAAIAGTGGGTPSLGSVVLDSAGNAIATVTGISATRDIVLRDGTGLAITGTILAGTAAHTTAGDAAPPAGAHQSALAATASIDIAATGTLHLAGTGSITAGVAHAGGTQPSSVATAAGRIILASGSALPGAVTLDGATSAFSGSTSAAGSNSVATLATAAVDITAGTGGIAVGAAIAVGEGGRIGLAAPIVATTAPGTLTAASFKDLVTNPGTTTITPGRIAVQTDSIALGGLVTALDGLVAIAPLTPGAISLDAARVAGHLSLTQADLANIRTIGSGAGTLGTQTVALGSLDGASTGGATGIGINSALDLGAAAHTLSLFTSGSIGGGGVTVAELNARAGGSASLTGSNAIQAIGGHAASGAFASAAGVTAISGVVTTGDFTLADTLALTLRGDSGSAAVSAGTPATATLPPATAGAVDIQATGITIQRDVTGRTTLASTTGVTLSATGASGDITQSGGTIATDGAVVLTAARNIGQSGGLVTAGGTIGATATAGSIALAGSMTAFGNIGLTASGNITQSGGLLASYGTLALGSGGSVSQTGGTLAAKSRTDITATSGVTLGGAVIPGLLALNITAGADIDLRGAGAINGGASFAPAGIAGPEPSAATVPWPGALDVTATPGIAAITLAGDYLYIGQSLTGSSLTLTARHDILEHARGATGQTGTIATSLLTATAGRDSAAPGGPTLGSVVLSTTANTVGGVGGLVATRDIVLRATGNLPLGDALLGSPAVTIAAGTATHGTAADATHTALSDRQTALGASTTLDIASTGTLSVFANASISSGAAAPAGITASPTAAGRIALASSAAGAQALAVDGTVTAFSGSDGAGGLAASAIDLSAPAGGIVVSKRVQAGEAGAITVTAPQFVLEEGAPPSLATPGTLSVASFLDSVTSPGTTLVTPGHVVIRTDTILLGGTVLAADGLVAIAPLASGAMSVDATRVAGHLSLTPVDLSHVSTLGSGAGTLGTQAVALGSLDGTTTGNATSLDINTGLDLTGIGHTLALFSSGAITAPGAITVTELNGRAGDGASLAAANAIRFIGGHAAAGAFASAAGTSGISGFTAGSTAGAGSADLVLVDTVALTLRGDSGALALAAGTPPSRTAAATRPGTVAVTATDITIENGVIARAASGDGISLTATTGAIAQTGGTVATDGNATLSAQGDIDLSAGLLSAGGTLGATAGSGSLAVSGSTQVTAAGNLALSAATGIAQGGGLIASTGGNATLIPGGAFSQTAGTLAASGTVAVSGATAIIQSAGAAIIAGSTTLAASGDIEIGGTLAGTPGFSPSGGFWPGVLTVSSGAAGPIAISGDYIFISGALAASTIGLAATHDILEHASTDATALGSITAASLTATAGQGGLTPTLGSVVLDRINTGIATRPANAIASIAAITATRDVVLHDTTGLTIAGPVAAGTATHGTAGDATHAASSDRQGSLGATVTVDISSTGTLQLAGSLVVGAATGGSLAASATAAGIVTLTGDAAAANALDIPGSVTAFSGSDGALGEALSVLTLNGAGGIRELGTLVANTLTGGSTAGGADLSGASASANQIARLDSFTVAGDFKLQDGISLAVAGPLAAGGSAGIADSSASGPAITVTGSISAPQIVSLTASNPAATGPAIVLTDSSVLAGSTIGLISAGTAILGDAITQGAGGRITGPGGAPALLAGSAASGDVRLPGSLNAVGTIGTAAASTDPFFLPALPGFAAPGGTFELADSTALTLASGATLAAQGITLSETAAGIAVNGLATTGGTGDIALSAVSGIGQGPAGRIVTGGLSARTSAAGDISLAAASNSVARLDAFIVASGAGTLFDSAALAISGPVQADMLRLTATGSMTLSGDIATQGADRAALGLSNLSFTSNPVAYAAIEDLATGSYLRVRQASDGTPASFTQTGPVSITPTTGAPATLRIFLDPTGGSITLADIAARQTDLILSPGHTGDVAGTGFVDLYGLLVAGAGGKTELTGAIANLDGQAAANRAGIVPRPDPAYRFNTCPIGSINCVLSGISILLPANPLQGFFIGEGSADERDLDLILPNVSMQDY